MTTILEPICINCKNYDWNKNYCLAFPDGIPMEILGGDNDHSKPLADQGNELIFTPNED